MVRVFSSVGAAVSLRFLGLGDSFRAIVDVCLLDHGVALGEDSTTNKILVVALTYFHSRLHFLILKRQQAMPFC